MHSIEGRLLTRTFVLVVSSLLFAFPAGSVAEEGCKGQGDYDYVCGLASAEDLVLVPGTQWIIASGFSGGVSLYLIDAGQKTWQAAYPAGAPRALQDMATYGACPGSPDPNHFVAHGLHIRAGKDGHSTLYVVGHGEREAIEVFDIDANGAVPALTWTGCVMTPDAMEANSVVSLPDGSLLATIPLHTGVPISDAFAGKDTGAVYEWSPGDAGFTKIAGTEMPYANGVEVSDDGTEFYIASSGLMNVTAFSNTNPAQVLRRTETFPIIPDNLHNGRDGKLVTAGLNLVDPVCGDVLQSSEFDLGAFAACNRPFTVLAVDAETMATSVLESAPALEHFSNVTMALEVGDELWLGTFSGDRVAYRKLADSSE